MYWRLTSRQPYYKEISTQLFSCEYCEVFKNIYVKGHLWTTASELYWFKVEEIKEKTETYSEAIIGDLEPSETSKVKLFVKLVDCIYPLIIFVNTSLFVLQGYEYASIILNKILLCWNLFHRKLGLQSLQIYFQIQSYLHIITLKRDIDRKFKTPVFHFRLIHPCSWILTYNTY